ncbi:MAG: PmoA family protein [Bacteroidales bacterium]
MKYLISFVILSGLACVFSIQSACRNPGGKSNDNAISFVNDTVQKKVFIYCGQKLFSAFWYSDTLEKPFLFPVIDALGQRVTRGFPLEKVAGERTDHPHHIGIWFNYGDVNGYDFWNNSYAIPRNEKQKYGRIIVQGSPTVSSGKGKPSVLAFTAIWRTEAGKELLSESTQYVFSASDSMRIIKRITRLRALKETVVLNDNKEGMFAIRVARFLEMPSSEPVVLTDSHGKVTTVPVADNSGVTGKYISSSGKEGDAVWGTRNDWVTLCGESQGRRVSITLFDHPSNPGYPAHFHARGYGLFAVNNLGQQVFNPKEEKQTFTLKPGEEMVFSHMIVLSSGKWLSPQEADKLFAVFSQENRR